MRVLVTRRWPAAVERVLRDSFDVVLNEADRPLGHAELAQAMREFDVVCPTVSDRIDAALIGAGDRVRLLASYGAGYEHIDVAAAKTRGIVVTNTPGVLTEATADVAMLLLLMVARRAGEAERELRRGDWTGWRPTHMVGSALTGKTLGLVGMGRIAVATARRARHGFGMRIAYFGRHACDPAIAEELLADYYPDLRALLGASDFVSIHVPGSPETLQLIDDAAIAAMRPNSYLVNTARGAIIDHQALVRGLKSGRLAGAGLDVFPAEPHVPAPLLKLENVVLLPHLGSADADTRIGMGMKVIDNIKAFARGEPTPDRVG